MLSATGRVKLFLWVVLVMHNVTLLFVNKRVLFMGNCKKSLQNLFFEIRGARNLVSIFNHQL